MVLMKLPATALVAAVLAACSANVAPVKTADTGKGTVLTDAGGMTLYRRLVPLFLGLVVGHYFAGGMVWGLLGLKGGDVFRNYKVFFGYQGFYNW